MNPQLGAEIIFIRAWWSVLAVSAGCLLGTQQGPLEGPPICGLSLWPGFLIVWRLRGVHCYTVGQDSKRECPSQQSIAALSVMTRPQKSHYVTWTTVHQLKANHKLTQIQEKENLTPVLERAVVGSRRACEIGSCSCAPEHSQCPAPTHTHQPPT